MVEAFPSGELMGVGSRRSVKLETPATDNLIRLKTYFNDLSVRFTEIRYDFRRENTPLVMPTVVAVSVDNLTLVRLLLLSRSLAFSMTYARRLVPVG